MPATDEKIKAFQTAATLLALQHGLQKGEHTEALVNLAGITAGVCLSEAKAAGADWREGLGLLTEIFILTVLEVVSVESSREAGQLAADAIAKASGK